MKAARFDYHAPGTLDEAVALKAELGDEAKILAGGQSLVPSMNFRLARPSALIDINRIEGRPEPVASNGHISVGPLVRHSRFHSPDTPGPTGELLRAACEHIGHLPIRTRGTFLGSIAHADPAAEWAVVALATDAEFRARSRDGDRTIAANEFFVGPYMTVLRDEEVLVEATIPVLSPSTRTAFLELSRRAGDFALICVGVTGELHEGAMRNVRIALGGVGAKALRVPQAESVAEGASPSRSTFEAAAAQAAAETTTLGDIHGSAEYRRDLISVYVRRALEKAFPPTES